MPFIAITSSQVEDRPISLFDVVDAGGSLITIVSVGLLSIRLLSAVELETMKKNERALFVKNRYMFNILARVLCLTKKDCLDNKGTTT